MEKGVPKMTRNKLSYLVQIGGIVLLLLNIWLASKLSPLVRDIGRLQVRVAAIEQRQSRQEKLFDQLSAKSDRILEILVNQGR